MRPWPGPAQRRGRGVSDGGRPPVGGQFRQPDRTPFFRLTPAFGLRSLRKNGYVPALDRNKFYRHQDSEPEARTRRRRWHSIAENLKELLITYRGPS